MNNEREVGTDPIRRKGGKVVPCTHKLINWNIAQQGGMRWDGMVRRSRFSACMDIGQTNDMVRDEGYMGWWLNNCRLPAMNIGSWVLCSSKSPGIFQVLLISSLSSISLSLSISLHNIQIRACLHLSIHQTRYKNKPKPPLCPISQTKKKKAKPNKYPMAWSTQLNQTKLTNDVCA